jgi:hypothetical protein
VSGKSLRKEKDCLNCGTIVTGRYCQNCGQENIVHKQSFWELVKHFIYDIFHFDGKFFDTLKYLLFRPGKVPRDYVSGKRTTYLDPIRMYLFTSAIFFIVFFSLEGVGKVFVNIDEEYLSPAERFQQVARLSKLNDSISSYKLSVLLDTTNLIQLKEVNLSEPVNDSFLLEVKGKNFLMKPEIDKDDPAFLTGVDTWLERKFAEAMMKKKKQYGSDVGQLFNDVSQDFLHKLPYLLFVSLPLFALILKLLYTRRKDFYYNEHAVFTLYHYIFSFILLLLIIGIIKLYDLWSINLLQWLIIFLVGYWLLSLFIGMRKFYHQTFLKTFAKFLLLNLMAFSLVVLLFIVFTMVSLIF